jgi:phage terminase large subunit
LENMKLLPIQKEILEHPARFKCLIAGRRFSKTFIAMNSLAKYARHPNKKCMYVAPSYRMAKQIVWEDLKQMIKERNWHRKINESELTITLVNGSTIFLRSADNPDSIRGIGLDYVVIDEAADISEEAWKAVIRPTLSDREGDALIIGTPKGRNWLYDVYQNAKHLNDWHSWQKRTIDGGQVSAEEIAQAKQDLDERTYKQEYEATFVEYSGLIYYAFGDHNITDMDFGSAQNIPVHIGMDFNVDPGCAVMAFQYSKGIHIYDELEIWGTDTAEMTKEIQRRYPNRTYFCYPDASGAQRRTSAGGVTDHIILKNAGFRLKVGAVNPSVKDRIAAVNSVCKATDGNSKLTISPKCTKMINALRKHTYKEGTRQPEKGEFDHFCDALGYMINNLYPVRVENIQRYGKMVRKV